MGFNVLTVGDINDGMQRNRAFAPKIENLWKLIHPGEEGTAAE